MLYRAAQVREPKWASSLLAWGGASGLDQVAGAPGAGAVRERQRVRPDEAGRGELVGGAQAGVAAEEKIVDGKCNKVVGRAGRWAGVDGGWMGRWK